MTRAKVVLAVLILGSACGTMSTVDGGADASRDAGLDAGLDAGPPEPPELEVGDAGPASTANVQVIFTTASRTTTALSVVNYRAQAGERCFVERVAPCWVINCSLDGGLTAVSLGSVELLRAGEQQLQMSPDDAGLYSAVSRAGTLWSEGDPLTLRAAGAEAPSVTWRLNGPPRLTPVDFQPRDGGLVELDRSKPFRFRWVELPDAGVSFAVSQIPTGADSASSRRVICELEGSTGSAMLPPAAFASLSTAEDAVITYGGAAWKTVSVEGHSLHLLVSNTQTVRASIK